MDTVRKHYAQTYIDTQFEIETMNAVPTPRLEVGENTFAAQLLRELCQRKKRVTL